MTLYQLNPLRDSRWPGFLDRHPHASVFHSPEWLEALCRTYGYTPIAFTSAPPGEKLTNGVVFARISSCLTGTRIVSLPFSDHCQPLLRNPGELPAIMAELREFQSKEGWKYVELRPLESKNGDGATVGFSRSESFAFHSIDLRPDLETLFKSFHKSCIQRKITRAEREELTYEAGRSPELLDKFYRLLLITRRRHQLPPQPRVWFQNLIDCLRERLTIHLVSKDGQAVASILTVQYKQTLVYKYGCSDAQYNKYGGTILLFWKAIQEGKAGGALAFDLGRSESDNAGLIEFKGHWGAAQQEISYYRYPANTEHAPGKSWKVRLFKEACTHLPDSMLQAIGTLLYRHVG